MGSLLVKNIQSQCQMWNLEREGPMGGWEATYDHSYIFCSKFFYKPKTALKLKSINNC